MSTICAGTRLYSCQVPISNILPILSNQHLQPYSLETYHRPRSASQLTNRLDVILWIWSLSILPGWEPGRQAGTCILSPVSRLPGLPTAVPQQCRTVQQTGSAVQCSACSPALHSALLRRDHSSHRPYYPVSYRAVPYHTARDGICNHPLALFWPQAWKR